MNVDSVSIEGPHSHHRHDQEDSHHHIRLTDGCSHSAHGESGLKRRLLFVIAGGACLLLSVILHAFRPGQTNR